jgi:hypothetical protein
VKMGNENPEHDGFRVGEDVMFKLANSFDEVRGVVRKATPGRVTVERDGKAHVLHRSKYGQPFQCRRVTKADIAHDAWLAERSAWERARPTLKHLALSQWYRNGDYRVAMPGACEATLGTMEQIAAEVTAIREWLRKRPEEPTP